MAVIKHLIETDYKGNFNNMGERIEAIEKEVHNPSFMKLTHEGVDSFKVGTDSNGVSVALDSTNSAVDLEGQTLVNLVDLSKRYSVTGLNYISEDGICTVIVGQEMWSNMFLGSTQPLKANTQYTFVVDVFENTLQRDFNITSTNVTSPFGYLHIEAGFVGRKYLVANTHNDLTNRDYTVRSYADRDGNTEGSRIKYKVMLFEGNHTNKSISYFEGLQSVGEEVEVEGEKRHKIEILSEGRNRLNVKNLIQGSYTYGSVNSVPAYSNGSIRVTLPPSKAIPIKPNTKVTCYSEKFSFAIAELSNGVGLGDSSWRTTSHTITTKSETTHIAFNFRFPNDKPITPSDIQEGDIMFVFGEKADVYEPYKSNKTEIFLDEPLRSVPNGVSDSMEIKDGKMIVTRRCCEIVLDGNSIVNTTSQLSNTTRFMVTLDKLHKRTNLGYSNSISDYLPKIKGNEWSSDVEHYYLEADTIIVFISKTKITQNTAEAISSYLAVNPLKVVYELETPIKEEFDLLNPILYKDGHVFLETGAVPCSSVSHEVALNTKAQVKNNSKAIVSCRNAFDKAVSVYDEMLLALDYDHTLFDFEYKMNKFGMEEV